jgi:hypothetical protein
MTNIFTKAYWSNLWEGIKVNNPKHPKWALARIIGVSVLQLGLMAGGAFFFGRMAYNKAFGSKELPNLPIMETLKKGIRAS